MLNTCGRAGSGSPPLPPAQALDEALSCTLLLPRKPPLPEWFDLMPGSFLQRRGAPPPSPAPAPPIRSSS